MSAAVLDHLWQSSLFALLAWWLATRLQHNGAHLRFWVWFAASVKFLVPFAVVAALAGRLGAGLAGQGGEATRLLDLQAAIEPVVSPSVFFARPGGDASFLPTLLVLIWAAGFTVMLLRWAARWLAFRRIVRVSIPSEIAAPIEVRTSATLHEPGVVGIFRPILLLPETIAEKLSTGQLQAILEHEFCHVRRRDNLSTAVHMLVEALFWFHPLVWWIGARMLSERERACDEAVLRRGHDRETYAQGILEVCRSYVASKLAHVSGASGADLKTRLEAIMQDKVIADLSRGKRWMLGVAAAATLAVPVAIGLMAPADALAGTPEAKATAPVAPVGRIQLIDGKRVKLKYQNVEVRSLLKAVAEAANVNMLVSDQVGGTVSLDLAEMPWDHALGIVLSSQGLVKREKDGIIFVEPA